jgi:chromosome segregation ATPase
VLKFGQVIDLELLDKVGPAQGADDLRAQLKSQEEKFSTELGEWDRKIAARTEELASLTTENTAHLHTVAELTTQQKALESGIRMTRRDLFSDPIASRKRETAERDHLVQIVNAQATEIKQLSSQIAVLRRKDTSVYS